MAMLPFGIRTSLSQLIRKEAVNRSGIFTGPMSTLAFARRMMWVPPLQTQQFEQNTPRIQPIRLLCRQVHRKAGSKLSVDEIRTRVLKVCAAFDKINAEKITIDSHFMNDLGLDSLDHVEVIMAIEDEFGFEIPDTDAEKLLKPSDITRYIEGKMDGIQ